jgi:uncharacterized membrane protein YfcA
LEILVLYLLLGAFAGTVAGLLGVGGGLIIVPVLAAIFTRDGVSPDLVMQLAIGTSLATIVLTSISSVRAHHRRRAVVWPVWARLAPGIVVGALLGAVAADRLPSAQLGRIFGVFELFVATQMSLGVKTAPHREVPGAAGLTGGGLVIGAVSALLGVGGGTLTVPYLNWCNVAMRNAVATSAACGLPIAIVGTVGFVLTGWGDGRLPDWTTGYVYWPAFAGITAASMAFAPLGARMAHALPTKTLRRVFALFLAVLGVNMLLG